MAERRRGRVRVHNFSVSLDGFGTGDVQRLEAPFGHAGGRLHEWMIPTRTFQRMVGGADADGTTGVDDTFTARTNDGIGVEIMGRHKFAPASEPWPDPDWRGWWGEEPPFHTPVIVLTRRPRPVMEVGQTTFHFLDLSPADALERAHEFANGLDVRLGGGVDTLRRFLAADLVDEMHVVIVPILLGRGERLWDDLDGLDERFAIKTTPSPSGVVHVMMARRRAR